MLLLSKPSPIPQLEHAASSYLAGALAPATLRVHGSGQHRYMAFYSAANFSPLPLVEHTLCMFMMYQARDGLTHQKIKSYLSAIRHYHILADQGDPFRGNPFPQLQYVLRGIKCSPAHSPRPKLGLAGLQFSPAIHCQGRPGRPSVQPRNPVQS